MAPWRERGVLTLGVDLEDTTMAIRDENSSSEELLRDSRYHRKALASDPHTSQFSTALQPAEKLLRAAQAARQANEDQRADELAVLIRTDYELDERLRTAELDVLKAVDRNRESEVYKAVFPKGLAAITAMRGEEGARAAQAVAVVMRRHLPAVAEAYAAELEKLAAATLQAEQAWKVADAAVQTAFEEERSARRELVKRLRQNEGVLISLFPGKRSLVRTFFRPTRVAAKASAA